MPAASWGVGGFRSRRARRCPEHPALPGVSPRTKFGRHHTTLAELSTAAARIEAWAEQAESVAEVQDLANRWGAIAEYVRRTSRDGIAAAEATLRRLEVRVGQLLGPASETNGRPLGRDQEVIDGRSRHDFRNMAEHDDIVEEVIAESTDDAPPSRRKVIVEWLPQEVTS